MHDRLISSFGIRQKSQNTIYSIFFKNKPFKNHTRSQNSYVICVTNIIARAHGIRHAISQPLILLEMSTLSHKSCTHNKILNSKSQPMEGLSSSSPHKFNFLIQEYALNLRLRYKSKHEYVPVQEPVQNKYRAIKFIYKSAFQ